MENLKRSATAGTIEKWLPIAVIFIAITAYYIPSLLSETSTLGAASNSDVTDTFTPLTIFQHRYVNQFGSMPQWIDASGFGYPAASSGQHGIFYLPRLLTLLAAPSPGFAADFLIWFHSIIAAFAIFALCRLYGMERWPAAFAGTTLVFSHLFLRWSPLFHSPVYFASFGISLLGLELIWRKRPLLGASLLAVGVAECIIGSHLQSAHLLIQALVIVTVLRIFASRTELKDRLRTAAISFGGIFAGLIGSINVWLPFLSYQSRAFQRPAYSYNFNGNFDLNYLLTFGDPAIGFRDREFYDIVRLFDIGAINADLYIGIFGVILGAVGFLYAVKNRQLFVFPILIGLAILVGARTPLLNFAIDFIPGWSTISRADRVSFIMVPALAILAGYGLQKIFELPIRRALFACSGLILISAVFWQFYMNIVGDGSIAVVIVCCLLAVLFTAVAFWQQNKNYKWVVLSAIGAGLILITSVTVYNESDLNLKNFYAWRAKKEVFDRTNNDWTALVKKYNDPNGRWMSACQITDDGYRASRHLAIGGIWLDLYESFYDKHYLEYLNTANTPTHGVTISQPYVAKPSASLFNASGVNRVLVRSDANCTAEFFGGLGWKLLDKRGDQSVYFNTAAFPLAYVSHRWKDTSTPLQAINDLAKETWKFQDHTDYVITKKPLKGSEDTNPEPAALTRNSGTKVTIKAGNLQTPGIVVLLDSFDPDWKATIDGHETSIERVNGIFRGVAVDRGSHTIVMEYKPWWSGFFSYVGYALQLLLLVGVLIGTIRFYKSKEALPTDY